MVDDWHDSPDSRGAQRFPAQFKVAVTCREWKQALRLVTANASRGGVFVRARHAPQIGSALKLEIELPDGTRLVLGGTVVHVIRPEASAGMRAQPGFGVKFDPVHDADLILLESMAQASADLSPASPPPEVEAPPAAAAPAAAF